MNELFRLDDISYQTNRQMNFAKWMGEYEIDFVAYNSVDALIVRFGGLDFVEKLAEFPSQELFNNLVLAINTGNCKRRSVIGPTGAFGPRW